MFERKPCRIAFGYKARSGKDEGCSYLRKIRDAHIVRISKPVYDLTHELKQEFIKSDYKNIKTPSEITSFQNRINQTIKGFISKHLDAKIIKKYFWKTEGPMELPERLKLEPFYLDLLEMFKNEQIVKQIDNIDEKCPPLLQLVAEKIGKVFWEEIWIFIVERETISKLFEENPNVNLCVPDFRHPYEAKYLKPYGFKLAKVERKDRVIDRDPNHSSEIALDNFTEWDVVFENNGTLEEYFFRIVDYLYKEGI